MRLQRYTVEKGKGVAYLLLSLMVLATILVNAEFPSIILLVCLNLANGVVVWYAVWKAGFRGVRIEDYINAALNGSFWQNPWKIPSYIFEGIALNLTWMAYIIFSGLDYLPYAYLIPVIFAFELIYFPLRLHIKEESLILGLNLYDWAFILSFAAAAISVMVNGAGVIGFVAVIPIWIGVGLKSLYDAPKWISDPGKGGDSVMVQSTRQAVQKLASMGTLSNSSRAGILMLLQKEKLATFTDLLKVTGMPKSSLRSSLDTLQKAGYISSRIVISSYDRPRTLFEATGNGENALNEYTAFMRGL